jgi:uncharacterized protein YndB with AHSA1/START domain
MKNLKTISFSIHIDSDREKIWSVLWNPTTYEKWSSVFTEGRHYKGELKQGGKIKFLGKDGGGMSSVVNKLIENEQMVFAHQKELKNGVEIDSSWEGAKEIYYLKRETDTGTELQVIIDITPDMEKYFMKVFPKALALVREISEQ